MVEVTPNPDSTVKHIETDSGKPTKVFYNWLQNITRIIGGFGDIVTHDASEFALAAAAPACFSVHKNGTAQTGVASATFTQITWATEVYDVGSHFASNLWTPPAGKISLAGAFYITGTIALGGLAQAAVYKSGSLFKKMANANAIANNGMCLIAIEDVATGTDTYELRAYQDNITGTGTINGGSADTWFMGHWISA